MILEKLLIIVKILNFIESNPKCSVPLIRDYLQIHHNEPPSQDEKNLYKIITLLSKNEYIVKELVEKRELGGAQFTVEITPLGQDFIKQLGGSSSFVDPKEKAHLLENLNISIRLAIRRTLAEKVTRSVKLELVTELSAAIEETLQTVFKDINFLEKPV